jgi:phosphatidylglycerol---prolipoprotein diacylglyceryl transferase
LNSFALVVGIGAALGLYRISRQQSGQWLDAALLSLALALLGARLGYVALNWGFFSAHLSEILQFWLGGLNDGGAVIGGLVGLGLAAAGRRVSPFRLADQLYPLLPPLSVAAWLGCWLSGTAYGALLPNTAWWAVPSLDESGLALGRLPVQLLASLCLLIFYWLLELLTPIPRPAGWLFSLAAVWMALVNLIATLLRADPAPLWGRLRADTWINLFLVLFFLALFVWSQFKARHLLKGSTQPIP